MTDLEIQNKCKEFLYREAELLDNRELQSWLELLTDDILYTAPVRVTREKGFEGSEFRENSKYYDEDKESLEQRVEKFSIEESWGENPPSRTRRIIGNIRVNDVTDESIDVASNLMMYHNKGVPQKENIISGERQDVLRRDNGGLLLSERTIYLDPSDLNFGLTVFF